MILNILAVIIFVTLLYITNLISTTALLLLLLFQLSLCVVTIIRNKKIPPINNSNQAEYRLKAILEYDLNMYINIDNTGNITYYNKTAQVWFENYFGKILKEGEPANRLFSEQLKNEMDICFKRVKMREPVHGEFEIVSIYGEMVFIDYIFVPVIDSHDTVNSYIFIGRDITKPHNTEISIKTLAMIPEEYPDPVLRIDYNGKIIYSNKSGKIFLETQNSRVGDQIPDFFIEKVLSIIGEDKTGELIYETNAGDDKKIYSLRFTDIPESSYINFFAIDLTEIKEAEARNNNLYQKLVKEVDTASVVIDLLLPEPLVTFNDYMILSSYEPSSKIGGDLLDIIELGNNRKFIFIGDVSGHGVQAALVMTTIKSIIKMLVTEYPDMKLDELLNYINKQLYHDVLQYNYLTLIAGIIDLNENTFVFINAGHPAPIITDNVNKKVKITSERGSIPLGWSEHIKYTPSDITALSIQPGFSIILYTDGLFDYKNSNNESIEMEKITDIIYSILCENNNFFMPGMIKKMLINAGFTNCDDDYTVIGITRVMPLTNSKLICIKNILSEVRSAGSSAYNFILNTTFNNTFAFKVEIVITEFLNNIIIHGIKKTKISTILIELNLISNEKVKIDILDTGIEWAMSSKNSSDCELEELNKNYDNNGRGMNIIHKSADSINRERNSKLNRTTFIVSDTDDFSRSPIK